MLALRRTAFSLRSQGYRHGFAGLFATKPEVLSGNLNRDMACHENGYRQAVKQLSLDRGFFRAPSFQGNFPLGTRALSSQAGTRSSGEEDDDLPEKDNQEGLLSEPELSDDGDLVETSQDSLDLPDAEIGSYADKVTQKKVVSFFRLVVDVPRNNLWSSIDQWVDKGNTLGRTEVALTMLNLRKRKLYIRALQLLEWVETHNCYDRTERDYASHLDLIAKVHGLNKAERYIEKVPKSFQSEVLYRTLLANSAGMLDMKKSEEVFAKMKDLGFPLTTFACNQLLLLYKKLDKKKIPGVLMMMEKENVKPSLFTYQLLIDAKGRANDIEGMEHVLETMKAEGTEPDLDIQSMIAKFYINAGLRRKAEEILKEMEGGNLKENRASCAHLLSLYASLQDADNVSRVWRECEENPRWRECLTGMEAWGALGKVEKAEEVFEKMQKLFQNLSTKYYTALLTVYASNNCLAKAKDLVRKMSTKGIVIGPYTWDALVKLYVEVGEVEKADKILQNAAGESSNRKPFYSSYLTILDQYSKRGDVQNAERLFHSLREAGYPARLPQYEALLRAYVNSRTPPYGIRQRMRADNVFPNKNMAAMLGQMDGSKKSSVLDLLD